MVSWRGPCWRNSTCPTIMSQNFVSTSLSTLALHWTELFNALNTSTVLFHLHYFTTSSQYFTFFASSFCFQIYLDLVFTLFYKCIFSQNFNLINKIFFINFLNFRQIRQRMQIQINNLQENFELVEIRLRALQNQLSSLKNSYTVILADEEDTAELNKIATSSSNWV